MKAFTIRTGMRQFKASGRLVAAPFQIFLAGAFLRSETCCRGTEPPLPPLSGGKSRVTQAAFQSPPDKGGWGVAATGIAAFNGLKRLVERKSLSWCITRLVGGIAAPAQHRKGALPSA